MSDFIQDFECLETPQQKKRFFTRLGRIDLLIIDEWLGNKISEGQINFISEVIEKEMRSFPLSFYLCSTQRTGMWGSVSQSNLQHFLTVLLVLIVEWGCCGTSVLKQSLFFRGINLPIYFKYVCGNVVDVSTLTRTMKELKAYNIDTSLFATIRQHLRVYVKERHLSIEDRKKTL